MNNTAKGSNMSAWKSIKKASDITLAGVTAAMELRDGTVHAVTLTDASGKQLRVTVDSYMLKVFVPEPPKKEQRFRVEGTAAGLPVSEDFEQRYAADERVRELEEKTVADTSLKVEPVEVEIPF